MKLIKKAPAEFINSLYKDRYTYINTIIKANPNLKNFPNWLD